MSTRPRSITILGWLFIAVGAGGLVAGSWRYIQALSASAGGIDRHETLDYAYAAASQILALAGGAFLLRGRRWARWALVVWMAAHVVLSAMHATEQVLVHCALFAPIGYFLFRRRASAFLAGRDDAPRVADE